MTIKQNSKRTPIYQVSGWFFGSKRCSDTNLHARTQVNKRTHAGTHFIRQVPSVTSALTLILSAVPFVTTRWQQRCIFCELKAQRVLISLLLEILWFSGPLPGDKSFLFFFEYVNPLLYLRCCFITDRNLQICTQRCFQVNHLSWWSRKICFPQSQFTSGCARMTTLDIVWNGPQYK